MDSESSEDDMFVSYNDMFAQMALHAEKKGRGGERRACCRARWPCGLGASRWRTANRRQPAERRRLGGSGRRTSRSAPSASGA